MSDTEINYKNLIESELFKHDYLSLTAQIVHVNLDKLIDSTDQDRTNTNLLAFFISKRCGFFDG